MEAAAAAAAASLNPTCSSSVTPPLNLNLNLNLNARPPTKFAGKNSLQSTDRQNAFSWTKLISDKTRRGEFTDALQVYLQMREAGVRASTYTFVAALKACASLGEPHTAKTLHAHVVESGVESQIFVATSLVDMYAKCGCMEHARLVFGRMPVRDVVVWNAIILGYAQSEEGDIALQLYARMQVEGFAPNKGTFVAALKACCSLAAKEKGKEFDGRIVKLVSLEKGRRIHAQVAYRGLNADMFVATSLLEMYAKCECMEDACVIFEKMPVRDVVVWNTIILGYARREEGDLALNFFARMDREGITPNAQTFVAALKACSFLAAREEGKEIEGRILKLRSLQKGRAIHAQLLQKGIKSDIFVTTTLVDMYAKCGSMEDARRVFDRMRVRDVVSWTAMILGYSQREEGEVALQLYADMQDEGFAPDSQTFVGALKACSCLAEKEKAKEIDGKFVKLGSLEKGRSIHSEVSQSGLNSHIFVANALVDMYTKCGDMENARKVFDGMPLRDVVLWNSMILGYAQMEEGEVALQLYARMQIEGFPPDARTFVGALMACASLAAEEEGKEVDGKLVKLGPLKKGKDIHSQVAQSRFNSDIFVATSLVDMYAKCGSMADACQVFHRMPRHDVASWNAMILGYAQKEGKLALEFFARMQHEGLAPDARTFVGVLKACGSVAALENGKTIHAEIRRQGLQEDRNVATSLLDMYGRCGSMLDAQRLFDALHRRDLVTWNALITGYCRQGDSECVFQSFRRMHQEGIQPDSITFLSVLNVCCHVGMVAQGRKYFQAMSEDYGITPTIDHYTCMIDLLGRAGELKEAVSMVKKMPFQPDIATWCTILGACQKWNDVELGRHAFECAIRLDEYHATAHVLMSNIYAAAGMCEESRKIQAMRRNA